MTSAFLRLLLTAPVLMMLTSGPVRSAEAPAGDADAVPINRIVALVNREVVTRLELEDRISVVTDQLRRQGVALPPRNVLEKQVLESLLLQRIQLGYAKENGIRIDEAQLDRAVARIADDY